MGCFCAHSAELFDPRVIDTQRDLSGEQIVGLSQHTDGFLWVSTAYSVGRFNGIKFQTFAPQDLGHANPGSVVMEPGADGSFWIGTSQGEVLRWTNDRVTTCLKAPEGEANPVWRIIPMSSDSIYVVRNRGIWHWQNSGEAVQIAKIGALEMIAGISARPNIRCSSDQRGNVYVFSQEDCWIINRNGCERYQPAQVHAKGLRFWDVKDVGKHWLAILSDEQIVWQNTSGEKNHLMPQADMEVPWTGHIVGSCSDHSLWVFLNGRLLRANHEKWIVDAGNWPPPNETIPGWDTYVDPLGRVWAASTSGHMLCVLPEGKIVKLRVSRTDLLKNIKSYLYDREGNLWAGSAPSMLLCWNAQQIHEALKNHDTSTPPQLETPAIRWARCEYGNTSIVPTHQGISLPPDRRECQLQLDVLALRRPEAIQFRYQIPGVIDTWHEISQPSLSLASLPVGHWTIEAQSSYSGEAWSEPLTLPIQVQAKYWETRTFQTSAITIGTILILFFGWLYNYIRTQRKLAHSASMQARLNERIRLARDLHDELGSELVILNLASQKSAENAKTPTNLQNLTHSLIQKLDKIVWLTDPRRDTLSATAEYLTSVLSDYFRKAGITCSVAEYPDLPDKKMTTETRHQLYMICLEIAQNIVKHSQAQKVVVTHSINDRAYQLTISDHGVGFDPESCLHTGDGLTNIKERMGALSGTLSIESAPGEGCSISLHLPLP